MIEQVNFLRCAVLTVAVAANIGLGEARAAMLISSLHTPMTEDFNSFAGTYATIPANFTWTPDGAINTGTNFERGYYNSALDTYDYQISMDCTPIITATRTFPPTSATLLSAPSAGRTQTSTRHSYVELYQPNGGGYFDFRRQLGCRTIHAGWPSDQN